MLFNSGANSLDTSAKALRKTSFWFAAIALLCLLCADLDISTVDPWHELSLMAARCTQPLGLVMVNTVNQSCQYLFLCPAGCRSWQPLAVLFSHLGYGSNIVRAFCAFIRSIHELFWALLFIQITGLSSLTGLLAIAIPYAGTLAKIYGELFEEVDLAPAQNSPAAKQPLTHFFYTVLPLAWRPMATYTSYRFECAIRSSAILGFVGLPTLGFHLETALGEGHYSEAAAYFYALLLLIGTLRFWLQKRLLPIYLLAVFYYLPPQAQVSWDLVARFITEDIVPAPLRGEALFTASTFSEFANWFSLLWQQQIWPGLINTVVLGQISLVFTGLLALLLFPLNSPLFFRRWGRTTGDGLLILLRTLPEYLLAFLGLLILGPSMLPAILALGIHNAAIIAHLVGRHSEELVLRGDASGGLNRYFYEVLPRIYRQFLAFLFYRWEVILRETAILGILGISTLGFYIDSAFEEFRFDRALY